MKFASFDALVERLIEVDERPLFGVIEIYGIRRCSKIVTLADQIGLCGLEGGGQFHLIADPQEYRLRVFGQPAGEVRPQCVEIEARVGYERSHPRAAVNPWNFDAVDIGLLYSSERTERL